MLRDRWSGARFVAYPFHGCKSLWRSIVEEEEGPFELLLLALKALGVVNNPFEDLWSPITAEIDKPLKICKKLLEKKFTQQKNEKGKSKFARMFTFFPLKKKTFRGI
jgi:hypothetical protein